jgi:hypothetical protein
VIKFIHHQKSRELSVPLSLEKTYQCILIAARDRRFVTYGQLAEGNGENWDKVRREMPRHLAQLLLLCHEEGWPLLTALVLRTRFRTALRAFCYILRSTLTSMKPSLSKVTS